MTSPRVRPAEFARLAAVSRQTVSRWIQTGKVSLGSDGLLDPERAFDELLENSDPGRLRAKVPSQASDEPGTYTAARAMNEHYKALKARAEYELMINNLVARSDVDAAMRILGTAVRASLDVFPDQATPLVTPITDLHEVHALLADACRNVLHGLEEAVKREQRRMRMEGTA